MGRVLLEGIAEGKPSVLIGYDKICGLVTPESFTGFGGLILVAEESKHIKPRKSAMKL